MRWGWLVCLVMCACGDDARTAVDAGMAFDAAVEWPSQSDPGEVPAFEQRPGDAEAGYRALLDEGIVRCGIPYSAYSQVFGPAPEDQRIEGRTGLNATLPFNYTAATTESGVDIVSANCFTCHATYFEGELVIGLGNTTSDYSTNPAGLAELARSLVTDPTERAELDKFIERLEAIGPYTQLSTVGVNPADNLAAILFAHRDRDTLAWSSDPLMDPPPMLGVPVDVPPWWRMRHKHAMFYVGAGRGDHARHMMAASSLCTDTVAEAEEIDRFMPDVAAYLRSIEPPAYPNEIDDELAAQGEAVFEQTCSRCHGTYGADGEYPNLVVSVDEVGTDSTLALGAAFFAGRFVDWYNESFYGELGYLAPAPGYYAPPLHGVWVTAPFLHNGSVPTIAALLDSSTRPQYWTRNFSSLEYDYEALGWVYEPLDHGKDGETDANAKKRIYDTTEVGYGNEGHTFGDDLTAGERAAVIEYLKTL